MRAANRYRPDPITTLIVAEAPPSDDDRYFYFEDVAIHDALFRYVARGVLGAEPTRENKPEMLRALRDRGVFLIDLMLDPVGATPHKQFVPDLITRVRSLAPSKVILVKAPVYDAAFGPLTAAGLPVAPVRMPFPGSGRQTEFAEAFERALRQRC